MTILYALVFIFSSPLHQPFCVIRVQSVKVKPCHLQTANLCMTLACRYFFASAQLRYPTFMVPMKAIRRQRFYSLSTDRSIARLELLKRERSPIHQKTLTSNHRQLFRKIFGNPASVSGRILIILPNLAYNLENFQEKSKLLNFC